MITKATRNARFYHLIGVVAWDHDCGKQNDPGVFTKIQSMYFMTHKEKILWHINKNYYQIIIKFHIAI